MTFDAFARSRRRGKPVELFLFVCGSKTYAYTDSHLPVTFDAGDGNGELTYAPTAIKRGAFKSSGKLDKAALAVTMPADTALSQLFRVYPPSEVVSVFVFQGHANDDDTEWLVGWSGRILSRKVKNNESEFNCEPISTSMKRPMLRRNYQIGCPLVLYSVGEGLCNADEAAATTEVVVSDVSGTLVTLPAAWYDPALKTKHRGGKAEWDTVDGVREIRSIIAVDPDLDTITLAGIASGLTAGTTIYLKLGCNHLPPDQPNSNRSDCDTLHSNPQNYGGQWLIPTKNPFGRTSNFY